MRNQPSSPRCTGCRLHKRLELRARSTDCPLVLQRRGGTRVPIIRQVACSLCYQRVTMLHGRVRHWKIYPRSPFAAASIPICTPSARWLAGFWFRVSRLHRFMYTCTQASTQRHCSCTVKYGNSSTTAGTARHTWHQRWRISNQRERPG